MQNKLLQAALIYRNEFGYSLVPAKNKRALVSWSEYQEKKPSEDQIKEWWAKWPDASIAIITGKISNITIVDIDSYKLDDKQKAAVEEKFPLVATPTAISAHGGEHRYFEYDAEVPTRNDVMTGLDIKNDGGMIIAPPSENGNGRKYTWNQRAKIGKMPCRSFPVKYKESITILINHLYAPIGEKKEGQQTQQNITNVTLSFNEGSRDQTLFYLANCFLKGGMSVNNIEQLLTLIASNICQPPFPRKEVNAKIQSALKRAEKKNFNLTAELREWIAQQWHNISVTNAYHDITNVTSPKDKAKIRTIMGRFVKEGLIERVEGKNGVYRKPEKPVYEDWMNADYNPLEVVLPFELDEYAEVYPGDIIVIAGVKNAGKTALALEMIRLNKSKYDCYYHSSELVKQTFRLRVSKCKDTTLEDWKDVKMSQGLSMINAKDRVVPDALNVFDYIEGDEGEFYKIPSTMAKIHRQLGNGIGVICLQKPTGRAIARGGEGTKDKASLYLTIDKEYPHHVLRVDECKTFKDGGENPSGFIIKYKIANGINLVTNDYLQPEMDKKYKDFDND